MDVLVRGGSCWLSHLLDLSLSFEVANERPIWSGDHIIKTLDSFGKRLFEVLIDLRLLHKGHNSRSVLVKGWH